MTTYISLRQLDTLVDLLGGLDTLVSTAQFAEFVVPRLASLIGCDIATYNEIGPQGVEYMDYPYGSLAVGTRAIFAEHVHEHPLVKYYRDTHDGGPVKISDLVTAPVFHRLNIYQHFFRPIPVEHQMAITLTAPGPTVIGIALNRAGHDFTETDRDVLNVLRGPLAQTFAELQRVAARRTPYTLNPGLALKRLTDTELAILRLVSAGETNAGVARLVGCSPRTVAKHLQHIYPKLGVTDRASAAARLAADYAVGPPA
ncbi:response regulator transcription factor [Specibacter sp. RAF43]|uniref:helix-turn-helix transcriptional regulator n=1 Tax=Specibacter sp. RAF43 TaxID=3233057 RepID=UPI003F9518A3